MSDGQRAIDGAMHDDRPAKALVREWWVEEAHFRLEMARELHVPLYLTLPGAEALDIVAMIKAELVRVNESGGLLDEDANLIVAFESNMLAYGSLKQKFPNLRARDVSIESILGNNPDSYPNNSNKKLCRALVVNLDYNGPFKIERDGAIRAVTLAKKFALIHAGTSDRPTLPWTLCLTFRARVEADEGVRIDAMKRFLLDEADASQALSDAIDGLAPWLKDPDYRLSEEDDENRLQRVLLCLVPAKIARAIVDEGWETSVARMAGYGHDSDTTASMVTFVFQMTYQESNRQEPNAALRRSHDSLVAAACEISHTGTIRMLADDVSAAEVDLAPDRG